MVRPYVVPAVAGILAALTLASAAIAQQLEGVVLDRETRAPIAAAFVVLLDSGGERAGAVLTDEVGRFAHRSLVAGAYTLEVSRIGFRTERFGPIRVGPGATEPVQLELASEAISLGEIRAEAQAVCRIPRDEGLLISRLWEEARKALDVAVWTETEPGLHARVRTYERVLDVLTLAVLEERGRTAGALTRNPFFAEDPDELARLGYVQEAPDGSHLYFGLSAEAILSRSFEDTHCFRVQEPRRGQDRSEIGLAFQPAPGRTTPGVEGVLWLDRDSGELLRVEYDYTHHLYPFALPPDRFGGVTEFRRLENGAWIVGGWWIRAPRFEGIVSTDRLPRGAVARGGIAREADLLREFRRAGLRVREIGGTVLSASLLGRYAAGDPDPEEVTYDSIPAAPAWRVEVDTTAAPVTTPAPTGRIVGRVVDAASRAPIPGATVRLDDGEAVGYTATSGGFVLDSVDAGTRVLAVEHLAYGPATGRVPLEPGATVHLEVRMYDRPIELEPMIVEVPAGAALSPRLADFWYRSQRGFGRFVHREEIERRNPYHLSDLLSEHGITVERSGRGTTPGLVSGRQNCAPMVYLDGFPLTRLPDRTSALASEEAGEAVNLVTPNDVEGIEIYSGAATVPPQFGGSNARCGVIVIWTRVG